MLPEATTKVSEARTPRTAPQAQLYKINGINF